VGRTTAGVLQWTDPVFKEKVKYTYSLKAFDAAGNLSLLSAFKAVTVSQAPAAPVLSVAMSAGNPRLTWPAATDNVGVVGYLTYRSTNGGPMTEVGHTKTLEWIDYQTIAGNTYTYEVCAYDAVNLVGAASARVTIVTQ